MYMKSKLDCSHGKGNEELIGVSFGLLESCFIRVGGKESQVVVRRCVSECSVYEMCLLFLERKNKKKALETIEIIEGREDKLGKILVKMFAAVCLWIDVCWAYRISFNPVA